jgi:hypothetical protein
MDKMFTDRIASEISKQKDQLIYDAIAYKTGSYNPFKDMTLERMRIVSLPGGVEIFSFDGQDLIHFGIQKTIMKHDGLAVVFTTTQEYKLLY